MKAFILLTFATIVLCEPPLPTYGAPDVSAKQTAPYPPSGWKPQGRQFHIVAKIPQVEYGPPETTTENYSTTEYPTTTEYLTARFQVDNQPQAQKPQDQYGPPQVNSNKNEKNTNQPLESPNSDVEPIERGTYYIYHPSGLLQRVAYFTGNDVKDMALVAQLRYKDVEPIKEPIYTYDPNTYVLKPLQV